MNIFILLITVIYVQADGNLFGETSENCYENYFFEEVTDVSLLHCGMKCLQRYQCQSLSYNNKTGQCRLHDFLATKCNITDNRNVVTLQRKPNNTDCFLETKDVYQNEIDVASACGNSYIKSPMVFEIKGGTQSRLYLDDYGIDWWNNRKDFQRSLYIEFSFLHDYLLLKLSDLRADCEIMKVLDTKDVYVFWLSYEWQKNGDFKFQMGEGKDVGRNMIFEKSDGIEQAHVGRVIAYSCIGNFEWKFYLQI